MKHNESSFNNPYWPYKDGAAYRKMRALEKTYDFIDRVQKQAREKKLSFRIKRFFKKMWGESGI